MTRVYSSEWLDGIQKNQLRFQCIVSEHGVNCYIITCLVEDEQVLDVHTVVFNFSPSVCIGHDVSECVNRACFVARGLRTCDDYNNCPSLFD